jgi:hypothetical protein
MHILSCCWGSELAMGKLCIVVDFKVYLFFHEQKHINKQTYTHTTCKCKFVFHDDDKQTNFDLEHKITKIKIILFFNLSCEQQEEPVGGGGGQISLSQIVLLTEKIIIFYHTFEADAYFDTSF